MSNPTMTALIATLGGAYSYSHLAAQKWAEKHTQLTGVKCEIILTQTIGEAFTMLTERKVDFAILPNENSTVSRVADFTRCLAQINSLGPYAIDQLWLQIRICLMAHPSLHFFSDVEQVLGRDEALRQCSESLRTLGLTKITSMSSNAAAAQLVADHPDFKNAAIGPQELAQHHSLRILAHNIQDDKRGNWTQFTVFGYSQTEPTGNDETLMLFEVENIRRAHWWVATVLVWLGNANLSSTHSINKGRNDKGFVYEFQVQFSGHVKDRRIRLALWLIRRFFATNVRVIGSFPASK
jgi:prephenate dehydratase